MFCSVADLLLTDLPLQQLLLFKITREARLWTYPWDTFYFWLIEMGDPSLNVDGTISWSGIPTEWRGEQVAHERWSLCIPTAPRFCWLLSDDVAHSLALTLCKCFPASVAFVGCSVTALRKLEQVISWFLAPDPHTLELGCFEANFEV